MGTVIGPTGIILSWITWKRREFREKPGEDISMGITGIALRVMLSDVAKGVRLSYHEIVCRMEERYNSEQTVESYINQFEMCKQRPKQSCRDYIEELGDIAMLAYGDRTTVQQHEQVQAQVIRWGKIRKIREN